MTLQQVQRIAPPSPEEFEARYIRRSTPVIVRGAIDEWPAMRRWSREYFRRRFGHREVPVIRTRNGKFYDRKQGVRYETIRLSDYVDLLEQETPLDLYVVFRVHETMPELFDDIVRPSYCSDASWFRSRFWFGAPDAGGVFHRDLPENLYAQINGHKRFILLDRRLTRMVHRHSFFSGVPNYSPIDAEAPDLDCYPRFRGAPLMLAEIEPGDLFYIPSLWWHQARSLDASISINLWWARGAKMALAKAADLFMRVRNLRL